MCLKEGSAIFMNAPGIRQRAFRLAYRAVYCAMCACWFVVRPRTQGVQLILKADKSILLVRHSYGHRGEWALPGGGRRRSEDPVVCARRELKEELGISGEFLEIGALQLLHDYRHDTVTIFVVTDLSDTPQLDGIEIVRAQWFATDRLPANLTPLAFHVLRRVGMHAGRDVAVGPRDHAVQLPA
jgi:ADP-ribose pyrophosphatase YjhB (NUDIX family)